MRDTAFITQGNERHSSECGHLVPAHPSSKEGWRKGRVLGSDGTAMGREGAPEKKVDHLG